MSKNKIINKETKKEIEYVLKQNGCSNIKIIFNRKNDAFKKENENDINIDLTCPVATLEFVYKGKKEKFKLGWSVPKEVSFKEYE